MTMSLQDRAIEVDEVDEIPADVFYKSYVEQHKPLIIRGAVHDWPAMHWSDEVLSQRLPFQQLTVDCAPGTTLTGPDHEQVRQTQMGVPEFIEKYASTEEFYYVLDQNLPPVLHQDIGQNPVESTFPVCRRRTFWWGKDGQTSQLHYDDNENIMCQLDGEKSFLLFEVTEMRWLYPASKEEYCSKIDPRSVDEQRWPLLAETTPFIARLYPGDVLYLPCFWWHLVTSYGRHVAVSHIINESLQQRLNVARKMIASDYLEADDDTVQELIAIIDSTDKPFHRQRRLKACHSNWLQQHGRSYYPHQIFPRLIEEDLVQILYGHTTY